MNTIPKTIHYFWFGNNPKNELIRKCMASWGKYLPEWKITEWNENNYDVNKNQYMSEAYHCQKYAFVADYARFDILYRYGGIYLDTDVEMIKPFPQKILQNQAFTGVESNHKIAPGLIFACMPYNPIVKEILSRYNNEHFLHDGEMNTKTVVDYVTEVFVEHGFKANGKEQIVEGFHVYPCEYFCAYDFDIREFYPTEKTISMHRYNATWVTKKSKIKRKIQDLIKKCVGINGYKKILKIKRIVFGRPDKREY